MSVWKQQNILYAVGVNDNGANDIVFISTDKVAQNFLNIFQNSWLDARQFRENNEAYLIDVKKASQAKNGQTSLPFCWRDGQTFYIAPIRGKGLWDAIWGYIAMDKIW